MSNNLIDVVDISKTFNTPGGDLKALSNVSLSLNRGETLGIVGESGCGKSTLARTLMMLETPDEGTVSIDDVDAASLSKKNKLALTRRIQMIFQDPYESLNPRMTAAQLIGEPWLVHKDLYASSAERKKRIDELLDLVGLRSADAAKYPQEFSGGQRQRLGIARALALSPDILVCDEPVSALDLSVQAQVLNLLRELQQELELAYVFIAHDLSVVRHVADRVAVMYLGRVVELAETEELFQNPRHPYTKALLSAAPMLGETRDDREQIILKGELPSPINRPSGCNFRTRCWKAQDKCAAEEPTKLRGPDGRLAECFFPLGKETTP